MNKFYSSIARLLAIDTGLVVDKLNRVTKTSFGLLEFIFKLFGLDVPYAVLVSKHISAESDFAFTQDEIFIANLTHIAVGVSANKDHPYVIILL